MKRLEATFSRGKVTTVVTALESHPVIAMSIWEVNDRVQSGIKKMWRGLEYEESFRKSAHLTVLIDDEFADTVVEAIEKATSMDQDESGTIVLSQVDKLIRIGAPADL
ncbi:MAG: P-II family nitrogen regulator [Thaumarchaeota archaeon]|nr:P-II family nitrogen regulator [Nitrososphaerota archaeon]